MTLLDERGRLFGRINLVDAAVVVFLLGLVPVAYGTYLLFTPATPRIDSVTRVEFSREERRLATGGFLTAKLKVRGTGFNPLLRAVIGEAPSLGFVFENPNSADVLVGAVPPGSHDLVLFDGVQEVARAREAVTIVSPARVAFRAVGWFTGLDEATAAALQPGFAAPQETPTFTVLSVGAMHAARTRLRVADAIADLPFGGHLEKEASIELRCDPTPDVTVCSVGGRLIGDPAPVAVMLEGRRFEIADLLPLGPPTRARLRVKLSAGSSFARVGDRDRLLDERAARVTELAGSIATLQLGVDESRDGWLYRGRLVHPGARFALVTDRYVAAGEVLAFDIEP